MLGSKIIFACNSGVNQGVLLYNFSTLPVRYIQDELYLVCLSLSLTSLSSIHSYAKIHIPIIASVSEHQPTTWVSFFFDLHILVCTFPAGLWFCIKNINDERVFGRKILFSLMIDDDFLSTNASLNSTHFLAAPSGSKANFAQI